MPQLSFYTPSSPQVPYPVDPQNIRTHLVQTYNQYYCVFVIVICRPSPFPYQLETVPLLLVLDLNIIPEAKNS